MADDNNNRTRFRVIAGQDASGNDQIVRVDETTKALLVELQNLDVGVDIEVGHGKTLKRARATITTATDTTLVAAVTGKKIKVYNYSVTGLSSTLNNVDFEDGASGTLLARIPVQSSGDVLVGKAESVTPPGHIFETSAATLLNIATSAATTVEVEVSYFEEA